jgi:hypothetical protein
MAPTAMLIQVKYTRTETHESLAYFELIVNCLLTNKI